MSEISNCTTGFYKELCGVNVVVDPQSTLQELDSDRILLLGQKSDTGTAGDFTLQQVLDDTASGLFGADSMIMQQLDELPDTAEVWVYTLPNTGTAGKADVTITGVSVALESGSVYLFVNGMTYQASFNPEEDTDGTVADKLAELINASAETITAVSDGNGGLTIESLIKGEIGGFLDVRSSYDRKPQFKTPDIIDVEISVTDPTGAPDLSGIAGVTEGFEFVVNPFTDEASMSAVSDYLCSQWSGGANSRAFGVFYGSSDDASAFGTNTNNALFSYMSADGALTPSYLESASYGAIAFNNLNSGSNVMAMSLTGQLMDAMLAPESDDVYTDAEKAELINSGVGYFNINRVNAVSIGKAVTTFTVKDNGVVDYSLADVNKPSMIAYLKRDIQERLSAKFTGYAFRRDGVVGSGSSKVLTGAAIRNFLTSLGQGYSDNNVIQDIEAFITSIDIDTSGDCISITLDPELVDAFCCMTVTLKTS